MDIEEFYRNIHGDYGHVQALFGSKEMMMHFMEMFQQDASYPNLIKAAEERDVQGAFEAAHTLKGVAANLGFTSLQQAASDITEQLRPREEEPDALLLEKVKTEYERIVTQIACIQ